MMSETQRRVVAKVAGEMGIDLRRGEAERVQKIADCTYEDSPREQYERAVRLVAFGG